jgi:hypothetical protein
MRSIAICTAALLLSLAASACSDDTKQPSPDQKLPGKDLKAGEATTPTPDGKGPTGDGNAMALSCAQATDCSDKCSNACPAGAQQLACIVKCNEDCKAKACESGKTVYDKLTGCIATKCIGDCLTGATPACKTCTQTKCPTEYADCNAHKC